MNWLPLKRRLLPRLRASKSQPAELPIRHGDKFDEATGRVYTETNIPIPSSNDLDWTRQIRVVREKYEKDHIGYEPPYEPGIRPSKGVRSLQKMVMDTTLNNIAIYTAEYLAMLPCPLLKWLWDEVNRRLVFCQRSTCVSALEYPC